MGRSRNRSEGRRAGHAGETIRDGIEDPDKDGLSDAGRGLLRPRCARYARRVPHLDR